MKFPLAHPHLDRYSDLFEAPAPTGHAGLRVTFLGVSTLLIENGTTAIMTDGFFSRPGKLLVLGGHIAPNRPMIKAALDQAGVTKLAAVFCAHSHYDHALDAPVVAELTGAMLVGSESTANIGRGCELPEEQIHVVTPGEPMMFGAFTVTLTESIHSPNAHFEGTIDEPLFPPAKASAYSMGECYSIRIEHGRRAILVHASANAIPRSLTGQRAEVVYLGIAPLGKQPDAFLENYWRDVVEQVGAKRVVAIHWDDFFLPLDGPLKPLPHFADDFDRSMAFLIDKSLQTHVHIALPVAWQQTDPFAGI